MTKHLMTLAILMALTGLAHAEEVVIRTKDKAFSSKAITVKVGDKITFTNDDPFSHNIFSLSEPGSFDLGTYSKGESRSVLIKDAGTHEVECAIHPEMKLTVTVKK